MSATRFREMRLVFGSGDSHDHIYKAHVKLTVKVVHARRMR